MNPKKRKAIKKNKSSKPKKQMPWLNMHKEVINETTQDDDYQGHRAYGNTGFTRTANDL